jgi:hypothetical protein
MKNISLIRSVAALLVLAFFVSGCAGTVKNMREVPEGRAEVTPESGKAMVVFMRPSGMGFAIQSSVFEVKGDKLTLAGIVAARTRVAYQLEPGKHLFMVIGEGADYMGADLQPNKTYYAYVTPRMGVWKARFSLVPVHKVELDTPEFTKDVAGCKWVEKTADSDAWMQDNIESIRSKHAEYYPEWMDLPADERVRLLPEDGR